MQKLICPHCQSNVSAPIGAGLSMTCTTCGQRFITPEAPQLDEIKSEPPVNLNPVLPNISANQPRTLESNSIIDKNVWIARNNQVFGPYLFSTLTTDNVLPTDYVGESPNGPWIPAQAFDGFGGLQQHQQPNLPTAQANPFEEYYRCICPHCREVVSIFCYSESLACPTCANRFAVVGIPIDFDHRPIQQKRAERTEAASIYKGWGLAFLSLGTGCFFMSMGQTKSKDMFPFLVGGGLLIFVGLILSAFGSFSQNRA